MHIAHTSATGSLTLGPLLLVQFNGSTHGTPGNGMMKLYDVAFTSYHVHDGQALLGMSAVAGISSQDQRVAQLRQRVQATESELHRCVRNDPFCSAVALI